MYDVFLFLHYPNQILFPLYFRQRIPKKWWLFSRPFAAFHRIFRSRWLTSFLVNILLYVDVVWLFYFYKQINHCILLPFHLSCIYLRSQKCFISLSFAGPSWATENHAVKLLWWQEDRTGKITRTLNYLQIELHFDFLLNT